MKTTNVSSLSLNSPQILERRKPLVPGQRPQWEAISYAVNVPEADAKLAQLRRFNSGVFRAVPAR